MEKCPLCSGPSFGGEPCQPRCDPGALRTNGILDKDDGRLGNFGVSLQECRCCDFCGLPFPTTTPLQKFCSAQCRCDARRESRLTPDEVKNRQRNAMREAMRKRREENREAEREYHREYMRKRRAEKAAPAA